MLIEEETLSCVSPIQATCTVTAGTQSDTLCAFNIYLIRSKVTLVLMLTYL